MSNSVITMGAARAAPAHIEIVIDNHDPIDLLDFTASLSGLAREHEQQMRAFRPGVEVDETRLLVVDIRRGSIVLELLPVLVPILAEAEMVNTVAGFVRNIGAVMGRLRLPGGRAPAATTQQLKNLADSVTAISKDSQGKLKITARLQSGEVIQEIVVTCDDARLIADNANAQRREIEATGSAQLERVLMRLHRSSLEDLKIGKRTSEKGIVERIDEIPRPLVYASDLAGQRIKAEILNPNGNPFQKGFIVDLDIETVGGRPRVYRIVQVHEVIDLEE